MIVENQHYKVEAGNPSNAINKVKKEFWGMDTLVTEPRSINKLKVLRKCADNT